ncbi:ATP-binding protein [Planomonospora parontospora]|uniref:ATP-binding protein n=1 Tax=Planomonospora parontospora TaxID=58119 RepID=UPI00177BFB71
MVADTGIGIPAEQYEQLFSRFFRASTAREAGSPGTGLGLATTKVIVEAHGGAITAAHRARAAAPSSPSTCPPQNRPPETGPQTPPGPDRPRTPTTTVSRHPVDHPDDAHGCSASSAGRSGSHSP